MPASPAGFIHAMEMRLATTAPPGRVAATFALFATINADHPEPGDFHVLAEGVEWRAPHGTDQTSAVRGRRQVAEMLRARRSDGVVMRPVDVVEVGDDVY